MMRIFDHDNDDAIIAEGIDYSVLDAKDPEALTEEEKIALLGRPCLGTNGKVQIRIKESKEFKVLNLSI